MKWSNKIYFFCRCIENSSVIGLCWNTFPQSKKTVFNWEKICSANKKNKDRSHSTKEWVKTANNSEDKHAPTDRFTRENWKRGQWARKFSNVRRVIHMRNMRRSLHFSWHYYCCVPLSGLSQLWARTFLPLEFWLAQNYAMFKMN